MSTLGKIAIVGAGAIGSYYGGRLAQAGHEIHFLLRSDYPYIKEKGLDVESCHGDFSLSPDELNIHQETSDIGPVDLVIIAWKTTANPRAKEILTPLLKENTILLTLQNGLGNCRHLKQLFPSHDIFSGLCFVCINRLAPGKISHTASGLIRLGQYDTKGISPSLHNMVEEFSAANIRAEAVTTLEKAQWMKLVWNIPFNGLAIAEGGVDTEVLLKERGLEAHVRALMEEVVLIAKALGHNIPDTFIDHQIERTLPMGPYRPSSMIDFVGGRPVEFEAIWERPLQTARKLQVPTPALEKLVTKLRTTLSA